MVILEELPKDDPLASKAGDKTKSEDQNPKCDTDAEENSASSIGTALGDEDGECKGATGGKKKYKTPVCKILHPGIYDCDHVPKGPQEEETTPDPSNYIDGTLQAMGTDFISPFTIKQLKKRRSPFDPYVPEPDTVKPVLKVIPQRDPSRGRKTMKDIDDVETGSCDSFKVNAPFTFTFIPCSRCRDLEHSKHYVLYCGHVICGDCMNIGAGYILCDICGEHNHFTYDGDDKLEPHRGHELFQEAKIMYGLTLKRCKHCPDDDKKDTSVICFDCDDEKEKGWGIPHCAACYKDTHFRSSHAALSLKVLLDPSQSFGVVKEPERLATCSIHTIQNGCFVLNHYCKNCLCLICEICAGKEHAQHVTMPLPITDNNVRRSYIAYQVQKRARKIISHQSKWLSDGLKELENCKLTEENPNAAEQAIHTVKQAANDINIEMSGKLIFIQAEQQENTSKQEERMRHWDRRLHRMCEYQVYYTSTMNHDYTPYLNKHVKRRLRDCRLEAIRERQAYLTQATTKFIWPPIETTQVPEILQKALKAKLDGEDDDEVEDILRDGFGLIETGDNEIYDSELKRDSYRDVVKDETRCWDYECKGNCGHHWRVYSDEEDNKKSCENCKEHHQAPRVYKLGKVRRSVDRLRALVYVFENEVQSEDEFFSRSDPGKHEMFAGNCGEGTYEDGTICPSPLICSGCADVLIYPGDKMSDDYRAKDIVEGEFRRLCKGCVKYEQYQYSDMETFRKVLPAKLGGSEPMPGDDDPFARSPQEIVEIRMQRGKMFKSVEFYWRSFHKAMAAEFYTGEDYTKQNIKLGEDINCDFDRKMLVQYIGNMRLFFTMRILRESGNDPKDWGKKKKSKKSRKQDRQTQKDLCLTSAEMQRINSLRLW